MNSDTTTSHVFFDAESLVVEPSDVFTIGIYCNAAMPIKGYECNINYDPSFLSVIGLEEGNIFYGYETFFNEGSIDNAIGEINNIFCLILGEGNVTESGYLFWIKLQAKQEIGSSEIIFSKIGITNEMTYLPVTCSNCTIEIKEIDIDQTCYDRGFPIHYTIDGEWGAAQNFKTTNDTLTRVDVYLRKFGLPEFNLILEIREETVDGNLIQSFEFPQESFDTNYQWLILDLDDIPTVPGTVYFIVCTPAPSGVTTSFGYEWGYAFGDHYHDGSFWFTRDGGALWRDLPAVYEFTFRTYGST